MLKNENGTLKGVGEGTELQRLIDQIENKENVIKVDLCKQMLGPEGAKAIMEALRHNGTVRSVLLGADEIGPQGAVAVGEALLDNKRLKTVFLGCNGIGLVGAEAIAKAIKANNTVEGYWLKRNQLTKPGVQLILEALRTNTSVTTLDLVQNDLGPEGAEILYNLLKDNNPNTESNSTTDEKLRSFSDVVSNTTISKNSQNVNNNNANNANTNNNHNDNDKKNEESVQVVPYNNTHLKHIYLSGNNFGVEGVPFITKLIQENSSITHLYLDLNNLGDDGLIKLSEAFRTPNHIDTLALQSNNITDISFSHFFNILTAASNKTLKVLNFGYSKSTKIMSGKPNRITDNGLESLEKFLATQFYSDSYFEDHRRGLIDLSLANNLITDSGVETIARGLTKNNTLRFLDLQNNRAITSLGIATINKLFLSRKNGSILNIKIQTWKSSKNYRAKTKEDKTAKAAIQAEIKKLMEHLRQNKRTCSVNYVKQNKRQELTDIVSVFRELKIVEEKPDKNGKSDKQNNNNNQNNSAKMLVTQEAQHYIDNKEQMDKEQDAKGKEIKKVNDKNKTRKLMKKMREIDKAEAKPDDERTEKDIRMLENKPEVLSKLTTLHGGAALDSLHPVYHKRGGVEDKKKAIEKKLKAIENLEAKNNSELRSDELAKIARKQDLLKEFENLN